MNIGIHTLLASLDPCWVAVNSFVNCHAFGVDSFLLQDTPGNRIRAFICRTNHVLWKNDPAHSYGFSVGLHAHHCAVNLVKAHGPVFNVVSLKGGHWHKMGAFAYESPIKGQSCSFRSLGYSKSFPLVAEPLKETAMSADRIHTVYVPKGEEAAWYVLEGEEDPRYTPITYSNVGLEEIEFDGLYQPVSYECVYDAIAQLRCGPNITVKIP